MPESPRKSQKILFLKKTRKITLIINRIPVNTYNIGPLAYIEDRDVERKTHIISNNRLNSHRGLSSLYRELSNKYTISSSRR